MEWFEMTKQKVTNKLVDRCFVLMHDSVTALAMVSTLKAGGSTIVYSLPGASEPECEEYPVGIEKLRKLKDRAEEIVRTKIILPKVAVLNA
jgi:hypothetical protein